MHRLDAYGIHLFLSIQKMTLDDYPPDVAARIDALLTQALKSAAISEQDIRELQELLTQKLPRRSVKEARAAEGREREERERMRRQQKARQMLEQEEQEEQEEEEREHIRAVLRQDEEIRRLLCYFRDVLLKERGPAMNRMEKGR